MGVRRSKKDKKSKRWPLKDKPVFFKQLYLMSHILELIKCSFMDNIVLCQEEMCSSKKSSVLFSKEEGEGGGLAGNEQSLPLWEGRLLFRYPCQAALFQYMYTWLVCIELTLVSWPVFPCGSFNLCGKIQCTFLATARHSGMGKLNVLFT